MNTGGHGIWKLRAGINMKKEPQIFTIINAQNAPVSITVLNALEQEEMIESIICDHIKMILIENSKQQH